MMSRHTPGRAGAAGPAGPRTSLSLRAQAQCPPAPGAARAAGRVTVRVTSHGQCQPECSGRWRPRHHDSVELMIITLSDPDSYAQAGRPGAHIEFRVGDAPRAGISVPGLRPESRVKLRLILD